MEKTLEEYRAALFWMWFAYRNKDEDFPHHFEKEAVEEAERLLGSFPEALSTIVRGNM